MIGAPGILPIAHTPFTDAMNAIAAAPAQLATVQSSLAGQTSPTAAPVTAAVVAGRALASSLGTAIPVITAAFPTQTSTAAANAASATANVQSALTQFVSSAATAASITQLGSSLATLTTAALQIASTASAATVVADACPPVATDVAAFQVTYNAYMPSAGLNTTGVYDAPTQAAVNTLIPGKAPSCTTGSSSSSTTTTTSSGGGGTTTTTPTPVAAAASTPMSGAAYAAIGIGAAGVIGTLAYLLAKGAEKTSAVALKKNPIRRHRRR